MSHSKALAIHSWGKGTPVALGSGKKRRRDNDEDSDEVRVVTYPTNVKSMTSAFSQIDLFHQDSGYYPSPTGGARKKRVQVDEDGVVGVIERVCEPSFVPFILFHLLMSLDPLAGAH